MRPDLSQRLNQYFTLGRFKLSRFTQGEGPEDGPITLTQRRIYILPSKHGIYFGVLMLVMLLGSINYNNSLGYSLTFTFDIYRDFFINRDFHHLKDIEVFLVYTYFCFLSGCFNAYPQIHICSGTDGVFRQSL